MSPGFAAVMEFLGKNGLFLTSIEHGIFRPWISIVLGRSHFGLWCEAIVKRIKDTKAKCFLALHPIVTQLLLKTYSRLISEWEIWLAIIKRWQPMVVVTTFSIMFIYFFLARTLFSLDLGVWQTKDGIYSKLIFYSIWLELYLLRLYVIGFRIISCLLHF